METRRTTAAPTRADFKVDTTTSARVVESLVLRGDLSALSVPERARFYAQMCRGLGLNPHAQPFAFLRLNGKEVLYATRGATDQLAAIHRVNREVIDGPKLIDLAGTKLVFCCVRATLPDGRTETAVATVPLVDPVNVLMKAETKGKRRATLSILGLGVLDEVELETIPAAAQEPGGGVDLRHVPDEAPTAEAPKAPAVDEPAAAPRSDEPATVPAALEGFYVEIEDIEAASAAVAVWMKHRPALAAVPQAERQAAWTALCARTEAVGKMKNVKVWLKKAIAVEDERRTAAAEAEAKKLAAAEAQAS